MSLGEQTFDWPSNIPVPRNSRTVSTPLEGSSEKVITDLIPTMAITEAYPVLGTTTYGAMIPGGKAQADGSAMAFSSYVLRKMKAEPGTFYTRCWFTRVIGATLESTPYRTTTEFDDHYWPPVLLGVKILEDRTFAMSTKGTDGTDVFAAQQYRREFYIPEVTEGTLFKYEYFVNDTPFVIGQYATPQPGHVSYEYHGVEGTFPSCLHATLIFDPKQTAFVKYNAATSTTSIAAATLSGQVFPATNFEDWQPYVKKVKTDVVEEVLHLAIKVTVYPPPQPDVVQR